LIRFGGNGQMPLYVIPCPALIGIDDDPRIRGRIAHGSQPRFVILRAELYLQERSFAVPPGIRTHRRRIR